MDSVAIFTGFARRNVLHYYAGVAQQVKSTLPRSSIRGRTSSMKWRYVATFPSQDEIPTCVS